MPRSRPVETTLDATALRSLPLPDDEQDDKRHRGTVLVIGGSVETPGAALLAGVAALRMGAGRLQIASAPPVLAQLGVAIPEALVIPDDLGSPGLSQRVATADAVVVGPGLSDPDHAVDLLGLVLEHAASGTVVVVDAMALDALVTLSDRLADSAARIIVTPNREELDRLATGESEDVPVECVVAQDYGVTVVSFGRIAGPDGRCYVDRGTVMGLGTSGAGDILAGAIGGVAARSGDVLTAAAWAMLGHRVAANRAAAAIAPLGYIAREIVDELPRALAELHGLMAARDG
ncbi:ADP-dependent NAD(P)H-hydrate dehydratase [Desertimonas flava]|uniref:ADP-dependent NAD(P)H-hydrate dehydratase n=1 Tax=Desertimonas flava TaxID=2064846 RepID=UPI000E3571BC|nr:ADP/ATP-dependent (S)-NAD(P)H-hydrate dehydratase [Desertimonas flava]